MKIFHGFVHIRFCPSRTDQFPRSKEEDHSFWFRHAVDQTRKLLRFVHGLWELARCSSGALFLERGRCYDVLHDHGRLVANVNAPLAELLHHGLCGLARLLRRFGTGAHHFSGTEN